MNDERARDAIDGVLLITTGTPYMRLRLDATGEKARLEPVENGGDTVTLDWSELSTLYNRGDIYLPQHPGQFGTAVDQLARNAVIMTDGGQQIPALDDVLDMELNAEDDHRYLVLYDEDYDDLLIDAGDSVAVLVDCNQACEILRLTSNIVADLAPEDAPDEEPIQVMIERLEELVDDG